MKQLALDIGLVTGPTLDNFHAGPNAQALQHLRPTGAIGASRFLHRLTLNRRFTNHSNL